MSTSPTPRPSALEVLADEIPAEIRAIDRWVLWTYEWRHDRWTKPPRTTGTRPAKSTDPSTWDSFANAIAVHRGEVVDDITWEPFGDGVGFVLAEADDLVAVDLDHCVTDGVLADWADEIVSALDTYAELSPSGQGVRLFARGSLPPVGRKRGDVEMYSEGRFVTVTGHTINGGAIEQRTDQLAAVHAMWLGTADPEVPRGDRSTSPRSDDAVVLERIRHAANRAKFDRLWSGDMSDHRGDHSAADAALVSILAFWTQDPEQLDRLFRSSGLMRPKWDQLRGTTTYGERTITSMLARLGATYTGGGSSFGGTVPGWRDGGHEVGVAIPESFDDSVVGEAFGEHIRGRWRHCPAWGWVGWTGTHWQRDETEGVLEEARRWVLDITYTLLSSGSDPATLKAALNYRAQSKLDDVVKIARRLDGIATSPDQFDRHTHLLNAANGVVDLRTGEIHPHDPALLLTRITPTVYDPDATHPDIDAVLDALYPDARPWMQRLFGYAATGDVAEDVVVVLDGTGSNGKSTLLQALRGALGDFAHDVSPRLLMRGAHDEHPALFADLRGRRLVAIEETAEGGALRVETMKAMSGGTPIAARHMRAEWFTFNPTHTLVIATNHRPAVNSGEHAVWRRLRLVPFPYRYTRAGEARRERDRVGDPQLRHRVSVGAAQRSAMLAWVVAGAVAWYRDGLGDCETVRVATEEWRRSEDVIERFTADRLDFDPEARTGSQSLYECYRLWCLNEGRPAASLKQWAKLFADHDTVRDHGVVWSRAREGNFWIGVKIRPIRVIFERSETG